MEKNVSCRFLWGYRERCTLKDKTLINFIQKYHFYVQKHQQINNILEVTVDFVSEIISCIKDKNNKILSGDPKKAKTVFDIWKFSRDLSSNNPNWLLTDTQT